MVGVHGLVGVKWNPGEIGDPLAQTRLEALIDAEDVEYQGVDARQPAVVQQAEGQVEKEEPESDDHAGIR